MEGTAIKYGDDVSTDLIFPGRYTYLLLSEEEMSRHALEDLDPSFGAREVQGSIIVAGSNWGCGSAREQAVKCIRAKGIRIIIAKSLSRIYYRNCINEGVLAIACPAAVDSIQDGDLVAVDMENSSIVVGDKRFPYPEIPRSVHNIFTCGGLIPSIRQEISGRTAQ